METLTKVRKLLSEHLGVAFDEIKEGDSLIDDLEADSLDVIELVMAVEEEFRVAISDDEADKVITVKDVVDLVDSKVTAKAA